MINLTVVIDNDEAIRKFRELQKVAKSTTSSVVTDADRMDIAMRKFAMTLGQLGVGVSLIGLVKQVAQVRGEFQQLEVAFTTLLQSKEKADALMAQMVDLAAKTPFDLQGVANGARQLLAYGFAADDVTDTLTRLGNVAAGLGLPLERLTYLYGTTAVQGRLYARDMLQFTGSGIPVLQELAKMYGKTTSEINAMVSAGKIGFEDVKKVIVSMTSEGGQFYNLMQEQSKTITGLTRNLGDAFDVMFDDIGKQTEGVITGTLKATISLVENYQKVIDILVRIVTTYGAYRAALILHTAAARANNAVLAQSIIEMKLARKEGVMLTKSQALQAARTMLLTKGWKALTVAIKANTVALLSNPITWYTAGISTALYILYKLITAESAHEKAVRKVSEALTEYNAKLDEAKSKAEELQRVMSDESSTDYTKQKALQDLIALYPELLEKYSEEEIKLGKIRDLAKEINTINEQRRVDNLQQQYDDTLAEIAALEKAKNSRYGAAGGYDFELKKAKAELAELAEELDEFRKTQAAAQPAEVKVATLEANIAQLKAEGEEIDRQISFIEQKYKDRPYLLGSDFLYNDLQGQKQSNVSKIATAEAEKGKLTAGGTTKTAPTDEQIKEWKRRQKKIADLTEEAQRAAEQAEIDVMKEGTAKKLAQIDYDYQQQLIAIEKKRRALIEAQSRPLTAEQEGAFAEQRNAADVEHGRARGAVLLSPVPDLAAEWQAEEERMRAQEQAWNEYLKRYGTIEEKQLAITKEYSQKINDARAEGNEGQAKIYEKEREEALSELYVEAYKTTSAISKLFGKMSGTTVKEMRKIVSQGRNALDFLKKAKWNEKEGASFGISKEAFDRISQSPKELGEIEEAIENVENTANRLTPVFGNIGRGFADLAEGIRNKSRADIMEALQIISTGLNQASQSVSFFADAFSSLGDAFGSGALSAIGEGLNVVQDALASTAQGVIAGGMLFGPIGAAAGAALGLVSSLAKSITQIHDKKREREIQRLQDRIDELGKAYDRLDRVIDKSYSKDAAEGYEKQNENLRQQQELIKKQIEAEKDKKNADSQRVKELENKLDDINNQIEDNEEAALDAIFGENIQSAIENFSEALGNAWGSGMNGAKTARDFVKKTIKQMVLEAMKADLSAPINKFREMMNDFWVDNYISDAEDAAANKFMEDVANKLEKEYGWADGYLGDGASAQSATSRGFQTMSEDTGSELNGRFTDIQGKVNILVSGMAMLQGVSEGSRRQLESIRDVVIQLNGNVADIREYTKVLPDMSATLVSMNRKLDNI